MEVESFVYICSEVKLKTCRNTMTETRKSPAVAEVFRFEVVRKPIDVTHTDGLFARVKFQNGKAISFLIREKDSRKNRLEKYLSKKQSVYTRMIFARFHFTLGGVAVCHCLNSSS